MMEQVLVEDFVQNNAVPDAQAESYVHIGLDDAYHPTGGYWFPSGSSWDGDTTGWVSSKTEIPLGELIQYPCDDDRLPEIVGQNEVPDWVVNRVVEAQG